MRKFKFNYLALSLLVSLACSCSSGDDEPDVPTPTPTPDKPVVEKIPINLSLNVNKSTFSTRATDTGYDNGDKIGLYVVNYSGSTAGTLQSSSNHVNNMSFTYDGTWTPASPIYWKDNETHADFYCYYPYASVSDIAALSFSVKADQSTIEAYKASEFLYGKKSNVAPTESAVSITTNHLFSCAIIKVAAGNGFTTESLAAAEVSVKLNNVQTGASINLKDGSVSATGEAQSITPLLENGSYKALIVPQSVSADNFITVTVDGRDFNLKKEFTFVGGKRHTFTVTVSKTSNGVNVSIGAWEDDGTDNGGTAE